VNILETEWWSMVLPPEWWAEMEDESILVGDRDDVGCLEFTTLHKESGDFERAEVQRIAESESVQELQWQARTLGDFEGIASAFVEDGAAVREWYVANGALLLFITYSCDEDNGGMDDAAVDEILDTLMIISAE